MLCPLRLPSGKPAVAGEVFAPGGRLAERESPGANKYLLETAAI